MEKSELPAPEVLKPQTDETTTPEEATDSAAKPGGGPDKKPGRLRRISYRPSHKATFIGLAVIVAVLAINAGIVFFLLRGQNANNNQSKTDDVVISPEALEKLGVNRDAVGNLGTELVVGPNSRFNGNVTAAGDVDIAGQLRLNSKFTASDASLTKLQAGDASLSQLNVNGNSSASNLSIRSNLDVVGLTRLQGAVTIANNLNVAGSLVVGGTLSSANFQANSLTSGSTLTVGGHIITRGSAPSASAGGAVGSNGTVSVSGNDASGTVAVNVGVGAVGGIVANVTFASQYGNIPHVVVTPSNRNAGNIWVTRTSSGFSIGVGAGLSPGGYTFDYIVMQ
ncbi:MAG TPA: hypothetical protein VLA88_03990 [Candidatus Saccharimonadales bacterium]|nr:hypothetical protein [Candidatus Saccharimonadales bacterium]